MTTDDPPRNLLPTFSPPPPTPDPDPQSSPVLDPGPAQTTRTSKRMRLLADPDDAFVRLGPDTPRPGPEPTPTVISSVSKPSKQDTTDLVVGLIALVAVGAGALIKWRLKAKLRAPDKQQSRDIAAPLARLALRHFDAAWLNADLADLLQAGAATGAYINDGPLLSPLYPDAGIPDDLQEDQL